MLKLPKLFIPVGIPGSGKSTFACILHHNDLRIVSTDTIREELVLKKELASVSDMSQNDHVFSMYHTSIKHHLLQGRDVIADATNLHDFARAKLRKIAECTKAEMHVLVFTNLSEAIRRNTKRERVVPPEIMGKMLEQYEKALRDIPQEAYTSVTYIESLT